MPVTVALIGLAASVGGGIVSAQGQQSANVAQATQAEINRKWTEFEKQMNLEIERGKMGITEMDRLYRNQKLISMSREQELFKRRAAQEAFEYQSTQYSRSYRDAAATMTASLESRGSTRGGTAAALKNQLIENANADQFRMVKNLYNSFDQFANERQQTLSQLNARTGDMPPMYLPSAPIPVPANNGAVLGAALSGLGQGLGALAGARAGQRGAAPGTTGTAAPGTTGTPGG